MAKDLVLDIIVNELVGSAPQFQWPEKKPEVRESWVRALEQNPSLLAEYAKDYVGSVTHFFNCLSYFGNRITALSLNDLPRRINDLQKAYR